MKNNLLILIFLVLPIALYAQQADRITVPYECDFEDKSENEKWVLNYNTPNAADQWIIGSAARNGGKKGLYISSHTRQTTAADGSVVDGDSAAIFGASKNIVMAYRKLLFPQNKSGKTEYFDVSFDWRMLGNTAHPTNTSFYAYVGPASALTTGNYQSYLKYASEKNNFVSNRVIATFNLFSVDGKGRQVWNGSNGNKNWSFAHQFEGQACAVPVSNDNEEYVILFVWINNTSDPTEANVGICIDNIQITSANISRPADFISTLDCEHSGLALSWTGTADYYELQYRSVNDDDWTATISPIYGGSYIVHFRNEGAYNLRIRGIKEREEVDDDISAWACVNNSVYWCPGNTCVNYIDLEGPNTICRYGKFRSTDGVPPPDADMQVGYIPDGRLVAGQEDNWEQYGRHRVIWEQGIDPRTLNSVDPFGNPVEGLQMIPDNVMATVRLGNPNTGTEHEDIIYKFDIAQDYGLIIFNYAFVGQTATHAGLEGFEVQLYDQNMNLIDQGGCNNPQFEYTDDVADTWCTSGDGKYRWSQWSAFGFNMTAYAGRTIYMRVHNWDCGAGGHSGHLYFYIQCVSAELRTDNCGESSNISIDAPAGFSYEWKDSKGNILSTQKTLTNVQTGSQKYTCTMCMTDPMTMQPTNCCIDLETTLDPRYPVPDFTYTLEPKDCENIVHFIDNSHIIYREEKDGVIMDTPAPNEIIDQSEIWLYRVSDNKLMLHTVEPDFTYLADEKGEVLQRVQRAVFAGSCDSVRTDIITIPSILTEPIIVDTTICQNQTPFRFDNKGFSETTIGYNDEKKNWAGCDSLTVLNLTVLPIPTETLKDTVCSTSLPYILNGYSYYNNTVTTQRLQSEVTKCDSMLTLDLTVIEKLELDIDEMPRVLCSDEGELYVDWTALPNNRGNIGAFDSLLVQYDEKALSTGAFQNMTIYDNSISSISLPFSSDVVPDTYYVTLIFYQSGDCAPSVFFIPIQIQYASLIKQKFNDLLVLLAGNYKFVEYQWYKNGERIEGATLPYFYGLLDFTASYTVRLTREDGTEAYACPYTPTDASVRQVYTFPTIVAEGAVVAYSSEVQQKMSIYTLTGQLYSVQEMRGGETMLQMPSVSGVYTLFIDSADGNRLAQPLVVSK